MRILAALLLCCLLLPGPATAGEENDPGAQKPPAQEDAEAAKIRADRDAIAAGVIGRGLVSTDEAVRKKAVDRLLARLKEGGNLEGFLRKMGDSIGAWANQQERLMEVWIDEAVNGTAEERERAVLLLHALGPKAVRRLTLELRHRGHHVPQSDRRRPTTTAQKAGEQAGAKRKSEADDESKTAGEPPAVPTLAAGVPRTYDVTDLLEHGYKRFTLTTLLRREADAISVKQFATGYVVTAPQAGHEALRVYLTGLRARLNAQTENEPAPTEPATGEPAPADEEDGEDANRNPKPPAPQPPPQKDGQAESAQSETVGLVAGTRASQRSGPLRLALNPPRWQITPVLLHLPAGGLLEARLSAEGSALDNRSPLRSDPEVIVGSVAESRRWAAQARTVPDARAELPWDGPNLIALNTPAKLFAGKEIRYSKDVRQSAGGAWRILTGTIRHGIELELRITQEAKGLRVRLRAEHSEVGLPLPVVTVRPSSRAAPVELEQPEWSTTRMSSSFLLSHDGGGAFLPLTGLGSGPDDHLVLVLSVESYQPARQHLQQAGTKSAK